MTLLLPTRTDMVDNGHGWDLEVRRYDPVGLVPGVPPLVFVPGYAMNTHILAFHPTGASIVEHFVAAGFEVWTANLRGQGASRRRGFVPRRYGLAELALEDVPAVLAHVLAHTATGAARVDVVGCSLGASILYGYLAHHPRDHAIRRVVAIGGPLRLTGVHPLVRAAFSSGRLAGAVRIRGTRWLASRALPVLKRVPTLLSIYMNVQRIDLSHIDELVATVDDPVPYINRQIARWIRAGRLRLGGVDIESAIGVVRDVEVLVVLANRDGIVPPEAARSVVDALGPSQATVLEVGDPQGWYAHADLFIGQDAERDVFRPLEQWLAAR